MGILNRYIEYNINNFNLLYEIQILYNLHFELYKMI